VAFITARGWSQNSAVSAGVRRIFAEAGLDIPALKVYAARKPQADCRFPWSSTNYKYPTADPACDVLIPAALENQITEENVIRSKRPLWQRLLMDRSMIADQTLEAQGVTVLPDILTNAGGVVVSYLEGTGPFLLVLG